MSTPVPVFYSRCSDYEKQSVKEAAAQVLLPVLKARGGVRGKNVLVKPNLLFSRRPEDPATVHPAVIMAVIHLLLEQGAHHVEIRENPGTQTVKNIMTGMGIAGELEQLGILFDSFSSYQEINFSSSCIFRRVKLARDYENFDLTVNLCKAKTHAMMTLTLGVKNLFGLLDSSARLGWHLAVGRDFLLFADLLLDLYQMVRPAVNIVDGIVGMEGNGPGSGTPKKMGFLAASSDALALDFSLARRLGVKVEKMPVLKRAVERELAVEFSDQGEIPEVQTLILPDPPGRFNAWGVLLPPVFKNALRNLIGSRPVVDPEICIGCGRCEAACPPRSLKLNEAKKPEFDLDNCIRCYCCQEHCPQGAIHTEQQLLTAWLGRTFEMFRKRNH